MCPAGPMAQWSSQCRAQRAGGCGSEWRRALQLLGTDIAGTGRVQAAPGPAFTPAREMKVQTLTGPRWRARVRAEIAGALSLQAASP